MTKNSNNNKHEITKIGSSLDRYIELLNIKCPKPVFNKLDTVIEINVNKTKTDNNSKALIEKGLKSPKENIEEKEISFYGVVKQ